MRRRTISQATVEPFAQVIGVDFSEAMLATAREYTAGRPNISLRQNDGATL